MRILVINSRDVERIDSGGARTLVQTIVYLSEKEDCELYTNFKILGEDGIQYKYCGGIVKNETILHDFLVKESIDVVLIGEARIYTSFVRRSIRGGKTKIISELHNMPGYERIGIMTLLIDSLKYNDSYIKRIRALILILFFPLLYLAYTGKYFCIFRQAYIKTDKLVLLSEKFFKEYKRKYLIHDDSKFAAIGNALSFDTFATEDDIQTKKNQLLVVTRFAEQSKRVSLILKTWERIYTKYPEWELILVGFGRSERQYRGYVDKHKLPRVRFEGKQKPENYYREAPIFLMTSAYEGWGMTLTEAHQMGCVPVAMNSYSSLSDIIIDGENGIITPNNDLNIFCEKVEWLMTHQDERVQMARFAIESSKRFERNIISEKKYQLIKEMVLRG